MRKSVLFYLILSVSVVVFTLTVALKKLVGEYSPIEEAKSYGEILTLWHVDSFEGGKGSRKEFLNGVAIKFSKKNKNMILVTEYTVEGILENFKEGKFPDMVSFGPSIIGREEIKKIPFKKSYEGEAEGKDVYAKVWCRGMYFSITREGVSEGTTVISKGKYNLTELACISERIDLKTAEILSSLEAYTKFCSKNGYRLIGTQRDIHRLLSKNVEFTAEPILEFSDLYQYISITTSDSEKFKICSAFIEYLLSDDIQKTVSKIGMLPAIKVGVYEEGALKRAEGITAKYTLSPFITAKELSVLEKEALKLAKEGEGIPEELKKFLK